MEQHVEAPIVIEGKDYPCWKVAMAELERRGTPMPMVEISGHAVDRMSQRYIHIWKAHRSKPKRAGTHEGLWSFMARAATEAIKIAGGVMESGEIEVEHYDVRWVIEFGYCVPILKTVK
jgi:hypothetical protein